MTIKKYIKENHGTAEESVVMIGAVVLIILCSVIAFTYASGDPDPEITVIEKAQVENPEKEPILIENSTINIDTMEINTK